MGQFYLLTTQSSIQYALQKNMLLSNVLTLVELECRKIQQQINQSCDSLFCRIYVMSNMVATCNHIANRIIKILLLNETEEPEKTVKTEVRGQGGAGLTFLGLGVPQGVAPKVPRQTGQGGLDPEQAYWIPYLYPWNLPIIIQILD